MARKPPPSARRRAAAKRSKPARPAGRGTERRTRARETLRLRAIEPTLTVGDLDRSVRFYTDALGFIVDERYTDDAGVLRGVMVKAGIVRIGLSQDDWKKGRDRQKGVGSGLWCVTVQDVDAAAARAKAAGAALTEEPHDVPWGGRAFSVDDPDGFHLTFYRR